MEFPNEVWLIIKEYLKPLKKCDICDIHTSDKICIFCSASVCNICMSENDDICCVCEEHCVGYCYEDKCNVIGIEGEVLFGCVNCYNVLCSNHYGRENENQLCKNCNLIDAY